MKRFSPGFFCIFPSRHVAKRFPETSDVFQKTFDEILKTSDEILKTISNLFDPFFPVYRPPSAILHSFSLSFYLQINEVI